MYLAQIPTLTIVLIVIAVIMLIATIILGIIGRKAQKRQAEQDEQIKASAQQVTMLIIDKKLMKMKDSGLPDSVISQTPSYAKASKIPIVKAKVGPKVMSFICDGTIFDTIPVRKEVKAMVSGLYISSVRGMRGKLEVPEKKKGIRGWLQRKMEQSRADRGYK
jgi:hypothetical protein